jgi:hypothetical protein
MLGFTVSQATVSRYLRSLGRRPTQSWRTFVRNQALAFGQYSEQREEGYERPHGQSSWVTLIGPAAAEIATACIGLRHVLSSQPALIVRRIGLRSMRKSRNASSASAGRHIGPFPESAEQSASDRGCGAKSTVQSSGITKTEIAATQ